jgi:hypothetical protein
VVLEETGNTAIISGLVVYQRVTANREPSLLHVHSIGRVLDGEERNESRRRFFSDEFLCRRVPFSASECFVLGVLGSLLRCD